MRHLRFAVLALLAVGIALGRTTVPLDGQTAAPPILLVLNDTAPNPFGGYLAEILRAEGINSFATAPLSAVDAATLQDARLVILAETPLSAGQATLFANYVAGGGRLVAMRPDAQLAPTLGLSTLGTTTSDGYVLIDQSGPGGGLQNLTLPFKGAATHYALAGATPVAALYENRTSSTGRPAVVTFNRTAAWSFDLARSTAYTRQGDPAFAGQDRDGQGGYRATDIFFQTIDLERVGTPHADVQMRLFSRVIGALLADSQPLPRLWYFPGTARTIVIPTGDSHTSSLGEYTTLLASAENFGARMTIYLSRYISLPSSTVSTWVADGHEMSLHPYFEPDGFAGNMPAGYAAAASWFAGAIPVPPAPTSRHHSLEWTGWVDPVSVMAGYGVRMDLSYYAWGPALNNPTQSSQAHGYITGSGQAMRFVTTQGQILPVYQQDTSLTDEQLVSGVYNEGLTPTQALAVSRQQIDASQAGGHSAIATQFHVDSYLYGEVRPWIDGTLAYAASLQIPMWPAARWLRFVEARAATSVSNMAWSAIGRTLSFSVAVPEGAEAQTLLVPDTFDGAPIAGVTVSGETVSAPAFVVQGQTLRAVTVAAAAGGAPRPVTVSYAGSTSVIAIADLSVAEGQSGSSSASVAVSLSPASPDTVTVQYQTVNGTATAGSDFTAASGTVTFAPFQTSQVISVAITGDTAVEPTETFSVQLSNPANAVIGDGVGTVTIQNDDVAATPSLAIADTSVVEGNAGTTPATFAVTLSSASASTVTVQYGTANGTAAAGSDYTATAGTLTFTPGITALSIDIPVVGDTTSEATETFVVNLSSPTNAVLGDAQGVGTIVNDDSSGPTAVTFQIGAGADDVNEDNGAFAADGSDVWVGSTAVAATAFTGLRFTNITIPQGATITSARLELQSVSPQWLTTAFEFGMEAAANSAAFSTASRPSQRTLLAPRVAHQSDSQWLANTWYQLDELAPLLQAVVNQPAWVPGNAVAVVVRGNGQAWARKFAHAYESDPARAARLVVTYAGQGPPPPPTPSLSINDVTLVEGQSGSQVATFTVSLSAASAQTVTVNYATANATATAGSDYTATSGTLTFTPGATTRTVSVTVLGDTLVEPTETFTVGLTASANATIADGSGLGTIANDDAPPVPAIAISDVTQAEGNSGSSVLSFAVTLSAASAQSVSVNYATANGTATAGTDYTAASGTLVFAPGIVAQTIAVTAFGDTTVEPTETLVVNLGTPINATIADAQGVGTLTNDDGGSTTVTVTLPVLSGADDVNEVAGEIAANGSDLWLGNGNSTTASFAGLRFANVAIPNGATITSAHLEVNALGTQWHRLNFEFAMEAAATSASFTTSPPSQRALLAPRVAHSSDSQWVGDTWYPLNDIGPLLQAAVNQAGWNAGNAVALVLRGTGGLWGRKFAHAFESDSARAPRLVVTYSTP
jgi:hypothetical protein